MPEPEIDRHIRLKAFEHVLALKNVHTTLSWKQIRQGFDFRGQRIHLATKARGIFKPKEMSTLLSIKTVVPKPGRLHWYDDQDQARQSLFQDSEYFEYSLMRGGLRAGGNRLLARAYEQQIQIIYFMGVAPSHYEAILPTFIHALDPDREVCLVGPGDPNMLIDQKIDQKAPQVPDERRYYMRRTQQRAHQGIFRLAVLDAYGHRCAITGLPVKSLLDAAHIVPDGNEVLGQPIVPNGLPLTKIHHAAFDDDLLGIDPDYRIHIADRLLERDDGPMLEVLKGSAGNRIHLPGRTADYPDRDRLAIRFEQFKNMM